MAEDESKISSKDAGTATAGDRPKVRGTAVGGQYISPKELFTTKAGREAIRNLIRAAELEKFRSNQHNRA